MIRLKEEFLNRTEQIVTLQGMRVLEVGCGTGTRSVAIAARCLLLTAVEPNPEAIVHAKKQNSRDNIHYGVEHAESLSFVNKSFDVTIFTLSFHHVPPVYMQDALDEAVRVTKEGGYIIFLEPAQEGSYFESEILFDAGDGDERMEKAQAYTALQSYKGYTSVAEIDDETVFQFDSAKDFVDIFNPKKNIEQLQEFLDGHDLILNAKRRINIYRV